MHLLLYRKSTSNGVTYLIYSTETHSLRVLCMPGDVNTLTILECVSALRQTFASVNFNKHNPHLSQADLTGLRASPVVWPAAPVFSPYTQTHDGYTQIR